MGKESNCGEEKCEPGGKIHRRKIELNKENEHLGLLNGMKTDLMRFCIFKLKEKRSRNEIRDFNGFYRFKLFAFISVIKFKFLNQFTTVKN